MNSPESYSFLLINGSNAVESVVKNKVVVELKCMRIGRRNVAMGTLTCWSLMPRGRHKNLLI